MKTHESEPNGIMLRILIACPAVRLFKIFETEVPTYPELGYSGNSNFLNESQAWRIEIAEERMIGVVPQYKLLRKRLAAERCRLAPLQLLGKIEDLLTKRVRHLDSRQLKRADAAAPQRGEECR